MPELICAADDPRWLSERQRGITATDITAIIGISPYASAYSLYWEKAGVTNITQPDSPRLRLGRELEPIILQRWREAADLDTGWHGWLMRSSVRPWQMATLDAMTGLRADPPGEPVEVKSWADADRHAWDNGPPPRVRAQVLWQMDTLDVAVGHVGVLFLPSGEFRSFEIRHEPMHAGALALAGYSGDTCDLCTDIGLMRVAGLDFMRRLTEHDPPPLDASTATLAALKARFALTPDKEAEIDPVVIHGWTRAKHKLYAAEEDVRFFESSMRDQLGEARYATVNGQRVARRDRTHVTEKRIREYDLDRIVRLPAPKENTDA